MKKKAITGIMLTLLLIGMLTLAFNVQPVKAEPSSVLNPVTLFVIPDEIEVTFMVGSYMQPRIDFQLGESIELYLEGEYLREGDFPHIASDIIFVVTNGSGDIVWSRSVGPHGAGSSSGLGAGWGVGVAWQQVDYFGSPVLAGIYAAGVMFVEPTYDFPEDFSGVIPFTIVNGTSVFVHSNQDLGFGSLALAVGDIDNDGDLDMIFGNGNNKVYRNDGNGTFTYDYAFGISGGGHTKSLRLGDLDGDGDLDLIEGILGYDAKVHAPAEIRIYENDGSGNFTYTKQIIQMQPYSYWDNSQFIELADIDNDGDLDIIISLTFSNSLEIFLNNGRDFVSSQTLYAPFPKGCAVGDIDKDGDLDIVTANSEGYPNKVFKNDGYGIFTDTLQSLGAFYTYSVVLGDIDNDGDLDLVTGNIAAQNEIYVNDGNGVFTLLNTFGTMRGYSHPVVFGDIDNDNDIDMITGGDRTYVYLNDGKGLFEESEYSLLGTGGLTGDVALADIDNDGDLDLITAGGTNKLYINTWTPISWEYVFEDERRDTTLKISTDDKYFQFIAPDKTFSVKHDPDMIATAHFIFISYEDSELKLITLAVDTKLDFCFAYAKDMQTGQIYWLIDRPDNWICGDIDFDGDVDGADFSMLGKAYRATPSSPNWNPACDINGDNNVDGADLSIIGKNYRKSI